MSGEAYKALVERIREKCQRQQWYGQELLVDKSGMNRTFPLQVQEEALNQAEEMG
jgi:hypothetical protein